MSKDFLDSHSSDGGVVRVDRSVSSLGRHTSDLKEDVCGRVGTSACHGVMLSGASSTGVIRAGGGVGISDLFGSCALTRGSGALNDTTSHARTLTDR